MLAADVNPANACKSASNLAFATVPESWFAFNVPAKVPPEIAPVVVILEEPTSIAPKLDVIEPPSKAPTEVMFVWAAVCNVPVTLPNIALPTVPLNTSEEFVASGTNVNALAESS